MQKAIYLVPAEGVDVQILSELKIQLEKVFGFPCKIEETTEIPLYAFNPKRNQYLSTAILESLKIPKDAIGVLGVTNLDLYVPQLRFVFGEASFSKRVAVISLCRLHEEYYGLKGNRLLFEKRAITEAIHELGHTFGLHHCNNPKCVMYFSNSIVDTDRKGYNFCDECKEKLHGILEGY
ncbi:MAG: archaemetzincin family Zn-dependent metalloprotease [bacterium]|nr:archaemetzincin family Zn-dependent metalloprotease [bacterium]